MSTFSKEVAKVCAKIGRQTFRRHQTGRSATTEIKTNTLRKYTSSSISKGGSPAPHPSQPKEAYFLGEGPGHVNESWENITMVTYLSAAVLLFGTAFFAPPKPNLENFATNEANARLERLKEDREVKYGKIYTNKAAGIKYIGEQNFDAPMEVEEEED